MPRPAARILCQLESVLPMCEPGDLHEESMYSTLPLPCTTLGHPNTSDTMALIRFSKTRLSSVKIFCHLCEKIAYFSKKRDENMVYTVAHVFTREDTKKRHGPQAGCGRRSFSRNGAVLFGCVWWHQSSLTLFKDIECEGSTVKMGV